MLNVDREPTAHGRSTSTMKLFLIGLGFLYLTGGRAAVPKVANGGVTSTTGDPGILPGGLRSIFGTSLATVPTAASISDGAASFALAGTRVTFGGREAALL